jgi:hypothetical protein
MTKPVSKETYLGDGLYASYDGFMVTLRAPRQDGDHWVGLEPQTMNALLAFIKDATTWTQHS